MASFLNRLKNLKNGSLNSNNNDGDSGSIGSFDEEGFLCPMCHRKFPDITGLEFHYSQSHIQSSPVSSSSYETNNNNGIGIDNHAVEEVNIWKAQYLSSEEDRATLNNKLSQEKRRVVDLEETLESLRKELKAMQSKVIVQSKEIGDLKAAKDVYDAQLTIFTDELLNTQGELKEKQKQVDTLCNDLIPRPTNDDVDVLKKELISVQLRMNEMSLEKEKEIEEIRRVLEQSSNALTQIEPILEQNTLVYNGIVDEPLNEIIAEWSHIKQILQTIRLSKENLEKHSKSMQMNLDQTTDEINELKKFNEQLRQNLEDQIRLNSEFNTELEAEKKKNQSFQIEIKQLDMAIEQLKEEKNQALMNQIDDEKDDEKQNLLRRLTEEKEQCEQQNKDLRKQIKLIDQEKDNVQEQYQQLSQQSTDEKNKFQLEISSLEQRLANLQQTKDEISSSLRNELSTARHQYDSDLSQIQALLEDHKHQQEESIEANRRLQHKFEQLKISSQIDIVRLQQEKEQVEQQWQQTCEDLKKQHCVEFTEKENFIERLSSTVHQSLIMIRRLQSFIEQQIVPSQVTILETIEQCHEQSQVNHKETLETTQIEHQDFLKILQTILLNSKAQIEKQAEEHHLKRLNDQQSFEQELNEKLGKLSASHAETMKTAELQQLTSAKKIEFLEEELTATKTDFESRTKKYDMQITALRENLATVRTDLKLAQEKLAQLDQLAAEKIDLEKLLKTKEEDNRDLLGRLVVRETENDKFLKENTQLTKKVTDLDSALKELALQYQNLQIHSNTISERRWLNDNDVHQCMNCNQSFSLTQRKHHCRSCGNIFCERCSSKTAVVAASSKKPQRVCDQCYDELTS